MTARNHSKHYCRHCEVEFAPTNGRHPSAHRLANVHLGVLHHQPQQLACTRYCEMAEQPEERSTGYRRYGPGAKPGPPPRMTYETLFPEEEDA